MSEEVMPSDGMVGRDEPRNNDAKTPKTPGLMFLCCHCWPEKNHRDSLQDVLLFALSEAIGGDAGCSPQEKWNTFCF